MTYTITKITTKNKKLMIEIDGVHHLFLYNRDLSRGKFAGLIKEGQEIQEDTYKLLDEHAVNRGKKRIMFLLGKQDYPKAKLRDKLSREGYCDQHIELILKPYLDKGFVDDKKLVNRRVETFKGYKSKREIEYKLKNSGFTSDDIKEAIGQQFSEDDELESALLLLNKKFTLKKLRMGEQELKKKCLGFLSRKGYPIGVCYKAFELFNNRTQDQ